MSPPERVAEKPQPIGGFLRMERRCRAPRVQAWRTTVGMVRDSES
jgi:hypothetical protein